MWIKLRLHKVTAVIKLDNFSFLFSLDLLYFVLFLCFLGWLHNLLQLGKTSCIFMNGSVGQLLLCQQYPLFFFTKKRLC